MNLHEYQGKEVLAGFGVTIQRGIVAKTAAEAVAAGKQLTETTGTQWHIVKAQIHAAFEFSRCFFPSGVRCISTPLPSLGFFILFINPLSSIAFNNLDKLVGSIPILGPKLVEGVPSESMLNNANPIAMVESN